MSLLNDILDWTKTLPAWQSDATRRLLLRESNLSQEDFDQLYELFKYEHGISGSHETAPIPLSKDHLPINVAENQNVVFKSLRCLKNVNRIDKEQVLQFGEKGITVIYGGNGSGKSGYARVMKSACRARDSSETVHPNANNPDHKNVVPTARFDIESEGVEQEIVWSSGEVSPEILSSISVFDSSCARSYLTAEKETAYLPYGLDIVESLAQVVLPTLGNMLEAEVSAIDTDKQYFEYLEGDTAAGKVIRELSEKTEEKQLKKLGTFDDEKKKRLKELDKALSESNPTLKSQELELSARRLKSYAERVSEPMKLVSDKALAKLKELKGDVDDAEKAERISIEQLQAGEALLPGTGDQTWKRLFESARKFSVEIAYEGKEFPHTLDQAVCPLCQEELPEKAADRLHRFEAFIRKDVSQVAKESRRKLKVAKDKIQAFDINIPDLSVMKSEIEQLHSELPYNLDSFQKSLKDRKEAMLNCLDTDSWGDIPALDECPRKQIRSLSASQLIQSRTFRRASDEKTRENLALEKEELSARKNLSGNLQAVLELLQRIKNKSALTKCKSGLLTRPISDKSKEFANSAVTESLESALNKEFQELGISQIKTSLKGRNSKGKTLHRLVLDIPTNIKLEEILSEGEQRAIAIASFLAELSLANHSCGIVFDDPVSSLDHYRRKNVARRLVEESKKRQVIIFTHDTSFLGQLQDEIEANSVEGRMMFLEWIGSSSGGVVEGLPWDHQGYKARIDSLEKEQRGLAKNWPMYPNESDNMKMRQTYDRLRATLERVIQDVVFNGVVKRYRDWIKVDSLKDVVGFDRSEYDGIEKLHKHCCDVVSSHDPSSAKATPIPTPSDLEEDIQLLKNIIDKIKERRSKQKKQGG